MPSANSPSSSHLTPVRSLTPVGRSVKPVAENSPENDVVPLNPEKCKKFECAVCRKILRYPVKFSECGHHCCAGCLRKLAKLDWRCPQDQIKLDQDQIIEDKILQSELDEVEVKCSNHTSRCPWIGIYKNLQDHIADCGFRIIKCSNNCGAEFQSCFLQRHLRDDCPGRPFKCPNCKQCYPVKEKAQHSKICTRQSTLCPNGCKTKFSALQLTHHLENDCTEQSIPCPYADAGCSFQSLRKDMLDHMRQKFSDHLTKVTSAIQAALGSVRKSLDDVDVRKENVMTRIANMDITLTGLIKQYESHLIWKIEGFDAKFKEAKRAAGQDNGIHSPFVAITRYGYRVKMIAYLNGYGSVEGLYMSLYVCLCSTEHDPLLEWPFHRTLELTLLDQCEEVRERKDITYRIDTSQEDEQLTSMPAAGETNPCFGTDKFISLDKLCQPYHYTADDAIFIRINFLPSS